MNIFKQVRKQLIAERYSWIREGVKTAHVFLTTGVQPEFVQHLKHSGCDCLSDKVYWMLKAYNNTILKGGKVKQ